MRVELVDLPSDPEPSAVYLQDLIVDLGERIDLEGSWSAHLGQDGLTMELAVNGEQLGFGLFGDEHGWRLDTWIAPHGSASRDRLEAWRGRVLRAVALDARIRMELRMVDAPTRSEKDR